MLTTAEAAQRLGTSRRIVQRLIAQGRLPARKFGRDWLIAECDLATIGKRQAGRPSKKRPTADPA